MPPWIVIDFETSSVVDLKKAGAYRYAEDICTEVLCLCWQFGDTGEDTAGSWKPGEAIPNVLLQAIELGVTFIAHNAAFERSIWSNIMVREYGWPEIPLEQWADSMARCCQVGLPASLDGALVALGLPLQKDTAGSKYTIGLSKPNKKGMLPPRDLARVTNYCMSDVENQVGLHKWLGFLPAHERPIWELSQTMNDRGLLLDMDLVRAMQQVVDRASKPLAEEFSGLTGGLKFSQVARVKQWVEDQGVPLSDLKAETIDALLGQDDAEEDEQVQEDDAADDNDGTQTVELPEPVRRALHIRRLIGSASIKKLKAMHLCVGGDGRARGLYRYHGTHAGRQTASLFQPHNFPRGTNEAIELDVDVKVNALMTGDPEWVTTVTGLEPVEAVVGSLRHTIMAEAGHCIMAGDYAGIQARTVLALAGQEDKTALMAAGEDVYCDMGSQIYRRRITKADTAERQTGKNSVLGLGFQMGWRKFHLKYCEGQPAEFAEDVVHVYRKEWAPKVPKLWYALQDAAVETVWSGEEHEAYGVLYRIEDQWLTAEILNGSKLWYFDPKPITKKMPWSTDDEPDWRRAFQYRVEHQKRLVTKDAFGGLLTQNVVMKIEREIVEDAKRKLEDEGYRPIMENHDEIVCEPPAGASLDIFREIMEDVPHWVKTMRIPIKVDAWTGSRYRK